MQVSVSPSQASGSGRESFSPRVGSPLTFVSSWPYSIFLLLGTPVSRLGFKWEIQNDFFVCLFFFLMVLEGEHRALHMLDKYTATELCTHPNEFILRFPKLLPERQPGG